VAGLALPGRHDTVGDRLPGVVWSRNANLAEFPLTWSEALAAVAGRNRHAARRWRLPTINELESLADCANHTAALPCGHHFRRVGDVYWSSTTSAFEPDWAWALHLDEGAVGVGQKRSARFHVWAVSGPQT
jgi:formylglycine-generating enzyme required for sulfatase activity